jgi:hypothetical protein
MNEDLLEIKIQRIKDEIETYEREDPMTEVCLARIEELQWVLQLIDLK